LVFPFTVDQQTKSEDITQIPVEKDIQTDKWFMSPPTRLELLTYIIDQHFKKEFAKDWKFHSKEIEKYFERGPVGFFSEDASVSFNSSKDIFVACITIEDLGKPKKPMKEACSEVLNSSIFRHFEGGGYLYQNTFLSPLVQESSTDPEIVRIVEKLQKNFLFLVTLKARFDKEQTDFPRDIYAMQCYKFAGDKKVHYRKETRRLKR
jgi:hypothetical protein